MLSCPAPFTNTYWVSPVVASITELECEKELVLRDGWREGGTLKELAVGDEVGSEFICTVASSVAFGERGADGVLVRDELRGTG